MVARIIEIVVSYSDIQRIVLHLVEISLSNGLSWIENQIFIEQSNEKTEGEYHLPTEVEWEHVCRSRGKRLRLGIKMERMIIAWPILELANGEAGINGAVTGCRRAGQVKAP